jgi:hypothetical protein
MRRHMTPDDAETARLLADDLGGLALALEQAGAFIDHRQISFSRYREIWRENWDKVAGWSDERLMNYPRAFAVTWQTSVDQLTPAGRRLLERLVWFAPEPVPNFLLDVPVQDVECEDLAEALANLADYSLARRNPDKQQFSIHRLVREVTRRSLAETEYQRSLVEAMAWVNKGFTESRDLRRLSWLSPHGQALIGYADSAETSELKVRLMNHLGRLLQAYARYFEAEPNDKASYYANMAPLLDVIAQLLLAPNRIGEEEFLSGWVMAVHKAVCEALYGPVTDTQIDSALKSISEVAREPPP